MVELGGRFVMGSDGPDVVPGDGESPARELDLPPFRMACRAVTNAQFERFVDETEYVTEAERRGWSFVFHLFLEAAHPSTRAIAEAPWWRQVPGADWRHPEGPASAVREKPDHPVVHVSWVDAAAYAAWAGGRLPTEAEWELGARGGLVQQRYPWGDELTMGGVARCNTWEGRFPTENTAEDGYVGTAPVDAYEPNRLGLYNMVGNCWEWCVDRFEPGATARAMRGGSYLCHDSYCNRYRVSARTGTNPSMTTGHIGFRVAAGAGRA